MLLWWKVEVLFSIHTLNSHDNLKYGGVTLNSNKASLHLCTVSGTLYESLTHYVPSAAEQNTQYCSVVRHLVVRTNVLLTWLAHWLWSWKCPETEVLFCLHLFKRLLFLQILLLHVLYMMYTMRIAPTTRGPIVTKAAKSRILYFFMHIGVSVLYYFIQRIYGQRWIKCSYSLEYALW